MSHRCPNFWSGLVIVSAICLASLRITLGAEDIVVQQAPPLTDLDFAIERLPPAVDLSGANIDDSITVLATHMEATREVREVITERYPDRTAKIERHVIRDDQGNYYNDGMWSNWDEKGVLRGTGEYRYGKRHGKWVRWFNASEGKMFAEMPYKYFQPPFVAEATFVEDKLDGVWTVLDSKGRTVSEWQFANGRPHGKAVSYFPSGQKYREASYEQGRIDGYLLEWSLESQNRQPQRSQAAPQPVYKLVTKTFYVNGRREEPHVEYYAPGKKKVEGTWLLAKENEQIEYDFWAGEVRSQVVGKEGTNQRHGLWTWYYNDGAKKLEGQFEIDEPVGLHIWWHANGQKMTEGEYRGGKEEGKWLCWHANGQKHMEGSFVNGHRIGYWIRWSEEGKVLEKHDFATADTNIKPNQAPGAFMLDRPTIERQPTTIRRSRPGSTLQR